MFKLRDLRIEPSSTVGLLASLGGSLAAAAYLTDTGWRLLLAIAIIMWSIVAASRLWVYYITSVLATRGIEAHTPRTIVEGERVRLLLRAPTFLPPGSLRFSISAPKGLKIEDVQNKLRASEVFFVGRIGEWCINEISIEASDPLGAFKFQASMGGSACIIVTPRPSATPLISKIFGVRRIESSGMRGIGIDYFTFREYQFGDEPRMIEWLATARLRSPIVKETEEARIEEAVAVAFIGCLDDYDLDSIDSKFEKAARIAISIVKTVLEAGENVHLYAPPHLVEKPLMLSSTSNLTDAGEAIAKSGIPCEDNESLVLPRLEHYDRAVIVSSRKLKIPADVPVLVPESTS